MNLLATQVQASGNVLQYHGLPAIVQTVGGLLNTLQVFGKLGPQGQTLGYCGCNKVYDAISGQYVTSQSLLNNAIGGKVMAFARPFLGLLFLAKGIPSKHVLNPIPFSR